MYSSLPSGLMRCTAALLTLEDAWCVQPSADLPEAFAVLGFAFYVQPMLMPLLHEMPPGQASVGITCTAVRVVVGGVASLVRPERFSLCFCGGAEKLSVSNL